MNEQVEILRVKDELVGLVAILTSRNLAKSVMVK